MAEVKGRGDSGNGASMRRRDSGDGDGPSRPKPTKGNPRRRSRSARARLGVVDYTLAKRSLLRQARYGLISRTEICDAHPELLRAARYVGEQAMSRCPVCDSPDLRLLAYVYADELKRDNGRVWEKDKALAIAASCKGGACYVVEVCTGCSWNHLAEVFVERSATG